MREVEGAAKRELEDAVAEAKLLTSVATREEAMASGAYNRLWGSLVPAGCLAARPTTPGACLLPVNATIDVSIFDDDESSQYAMPLTMPWAYQPFFLTALSMDQELATSYNEAYREGELNCEDIWKGWGHSFCTQLLPPV